MKCQQESYLVKIRNMTDSCNIDYLFCMAAVDKTRLQPPTHVQVTHKSTHMHSGTLFLWVSLFFSLCVHLPFLFLFFLPPFSHSFPPAHRLFTSLLPLLSLLFLSFIFLLLYLPHIILYIISMYALRLPPNHTNQLHDLLHSLSARRPKMTHWADWRQKRPCLQQDLAIHQAVLFYRLYTVYSRLQLYVRSKGREEEREKEGRKRVVREGEKRMWEEGGR